MRFLSVICLLLGLYTSVHAGLVITKKKIVKFGKVTEEENRVVLEVKIGDMSGRNYFKKSDIIYFTTHKKVTSYYLGAKYAYKTKKFKISKFLAELSLKHEPKNKRKAEELLIFINKLNKIESTKDKDEDEDDDWDDY